MKCTYLALFLILNVTIAFSIKLKEKPDSPKHITEITTNDHKPIKNESVEYVKNLRGEFVLGLSNSNSEQISASKNNENNVKKAKELVTVISPSVHDPTPRKNVIQIGIPPATKEVENYSYHISERLNSLREKADKSTETKRISKDVENIVNKGIQDAETLHKKAEQLQIKLLSDK